MFCRIPKLPTQGHVHLSAAEWEAELQCLRWVNGTVRSRICLAAGARVGEPGPGRNRTLSYL